MKPIRLAIAVAGLACCTTAFGQNPLPTADARPIPAPFVPDAAWSQGETCGLQCDGCQHRYCYWKWYAKRPMLTDWLISPCDMIPRHLEVFPVAHENYYFRPYHPQDIPRQQGEAGAWGGDPRNPYHDDLFRAARRSAFGPKEEVMIPPPTELQPLEPPSR